ncbi:IQ and ubiquitin-like domain-containing protein [Diorhabda sublineata]|uniref:IQ and ubiquitin-like domain-containing protein n=1 Tax=Diorhabda sublineata TaxID=1163346 RepID=UPI0024E0C737|nr:IQ and ubiquitin-like domain-containing protein [Diorhabda sublineata]
MPCWICKCVCGPKCECDCKCTHVPVPTWMEGVVLEWPSFSDMYKDTQIILKFTTANANVFTQTYTSGQKILEDLVVPDILTINIDEGENKHRQVVVEVHNKAIQKPMLGGYKHTQTGVRYFHGYSQTGPPPPKVPPDHKNHRDTQTYIMRNRKTQMAYAHATQMANLEIYIPSVTDKILTPGPYETADEREKRLDIDGKVRTIQRYFRAWKMRKALKELSAEYRKRVRLENEQDEKERLDDEKRKRQDVISTVFPMNMSDFAMLYAMVDRWKKNEIARITSMHCGASKIAELYLLLEKEIEMLRVIESMRNRVYKELEYKRIQDFFKKIGEPIDWYSTYKSLHIFMDTLETQKGRKYFELYQKLIEKDLTVEQKLNVYLEVKEYIQDHQCQDSEVLNNLIDRMCQLLVRGVSRKNLQGLEKRIEACVLHHFKLIECNEGVTRHMLTVQERKMEKNLQYCPRCQKFKTIDGFKLTARTDKLRICRNCKWLDKSEEPWVDLSPYRFILKQIRNYERLHHAVSSVAFILQDIDIHHIIVQIWHGHSALSECNDIYQLRLVRWDIHKEWAPWNCILLTAEEAKAHLKVISLSYVYEEEFISHVTNKHVLARRHFSNLKAFDKYFAETTKGDIRLDENSEYYNKPKTECLKDEDIKYSDRLLCKKGLL